jgi:hypothetical protein
MRQVAGVPGAAGRCQRLVGDAAERLTAIIQRVQQHPPGDQLDLTAPEQLAP